MRLGVVLDRYAQILENEGIISTISIFLEVSLIPWSSQAEIFFLSGVHIALLHSKNVWWTISKGLAFALKYLSQTSRDIAHQC